MHGLRGFVRKRMRNDSIIVPFSLFSLLLLLLPSSFFLYFPSNESYHPTLTPFIHHSYTHPFIFIIKQTNLF